MKYYVHGSEDSLDKDVIYVFDYPPSFEQAKSFCDTETEKENRNIICIEDSVVSWCYKGTIDELNNGIYRTYHLHKQEYELEIKRLVKRNIALKHIRVMRCLLSHCSRTEYRSIIKQALKSYDWDEKISILEKINFSSISDFKKDSTTEVYKTFAFQLAQCFGLHYGKEIYTKSEASKAYPALKPYLYREENYSEKDLTNAIKSFIMLSKEIEVFKETAYRLNFDKNTKTKELTGFSIFPEYGLKIDLRTEKVI